jgi:hypothetical protein
MEFFVPAVQLPRNLDETRLGFIRREEDRIESVGTCCLDLLAVLFAIASPARETERGYLGTVGIWCTLSTVFGSHLFLMLCVTMRSTFAARTP